MFIGILTPKYNFLMLCDKVWKSFIIICKKNQVSSKFCCKGLKITNCRYRIVYVIYPLIFWDALWLFPVNWLQHSYCSMSNILQKAEIVQLIMLMLYYECCNQFTGNSHTAFQKNRWKITYTILYLHSCYKWIMKTKSITITIIIYIFKKK